MPGSSTRVINIDSLHKVSKRYTDGQTMIERRRPNDRLHVHMGLIKIALLSKKCNVFLVMFEVSEWALTVLEVLELNKQT